MRLKNEFMNRCFDVIPNRDGFWPREMALLVAEAAMRELRDGDVSPAGFVEADDSVRKLVVDELSKAMTEGVRPVRWI